MLSNYNQGTTIVDLNQAGFHSFSRRESSSGLHYYFVFCANTKIDSLAYDEREKFYRFIASCVQVMQGSFETVGGKDECVHLLVSLNLTQNPADFAGKIKLLSAAWAKRNLELKDFDWSDEEISTVSESQYNHLSRSIERQSKTFFRKKLSLSH